MKPSWLLEQQTIIVNESEEDALKRVPISKIQNTEFQRLLLDIVKTCDEKDIEWVRRSSSLPKHPQRASRAVFPTDNKDIALFSNDFGFYIEADSALWLEFLFKTYKDLQERIPKYKQAWTRLLTCKPIAAEPFDNPNITYKTVRRELNLSIGQLEDDTVDKLKLFLETIFHGFNLTETDIYIKKEGSPGYVAFDVDHESKKITFAKRLWNRLDKFGAFKKKIFEKFVLDLDKIKKLFIKGDLKSLLTYHLVVFLSRLVERLQEDEEGKIRRVKDCDALLSKNTNLTNLDYKNPVRKHVSAIKFISDEITKWFKACRRRLAYAAEALAAFLGNAILPQFRDFIKTKYPWIFKFGSDEQLKEYITNYLEKKGFGLNEVELMSLDVTQFDHSVDYTHLVAYHDFIEKHHELCGWFLAAQAISPIAVGDLGYSKRQKKKVTNLLIGDPLDYKTWFFGQGKSGDADVADRCKMLCSWTMTMMIADLCGLDYSGENISKIMNWETDIAFLNLGDNNLIVAKKGYRAKIESWLSSNPFYRAELDAEPIFGGKSFEIINNQLMIKRSPLSFAIKLLSPEYSYDSEEHIGWTEGFLQRIADARLEQTLYNDSTLLTIIDIVNKNLNEILNTSDLETLANLYHDRFISYTEETSSLFNLLSEHSDDFRIKELLLDIEKIRWKWDWNEFDEDIQQTLLEFTMTKLDTTITKKLFKE